MNRIKISHMKKKLAVTLSIFACAYLLGVLIVKYQLPPYSLLKVTNEKHRILDKSIKSSLLERHFIDPVSEYDKLEYPPVTTLEELANRIDKFMVSIDSFETAFDRIKILASSLEGHILKLQFEYMDTPITTYAYYKDSLNRNRNDVGIHIIPGSGKNQSSAIFYNKESNYQRNIDDIAQNYGDVFILVKPNEDFLAIHNGINKIGGKSFINHLLNNGSSYSAYYVIQSLALSKFIKTKYKKLYVCGLSQGGLAALINSLQSTPHKAVIASGFSVLMNKPYLSNHNQLIIPNYRAVYNADGIKTQIGKTSTKFLFTWGTKERGIFGIDAQETLTLKFFEGKTNILSYIHQEGHVYYEPAIIAFFEKKS
jgi:hypothetical protein